MCIHAVAHDKLKLVLCFSQVHCCGVDSYRDWGNVTWYPEVDNAVPLSCCAEVGGCGDRKYLELAPNGGIVGDVKVWTTVSDVISMYATTTLLKIIVGYKSSLVSYADAKLTTKAKFANQSCCKT